MLVDGVALCEMVSVPLRAPAAVGVNVIDTVHDPAAARLVPNVQVLLLMAKSGPERLVAPSSKGAVPELARVTLCVPDVAPTLVDENVSCNADNDAPGEPAGTPVPVNDTELLAGVALWAIVSVPLRLPAAVGANDTEIVQLADAARLLPEVQVLLPTAKSLPAIAVVPSTNAALPVLVSVTVCAAAVVPTVVDPNVNCVGDTLAAGAPAAAPVPDSVTLLLAGEALCVMVSVALRAPGAEGVKLTDTLQLAPAARLLPDVQLLLPTAKSAPAIEVVPSTNAAFPVLVNVTLCAAAVAPTVVEPNDNWAGETLAAGDPTAAPVPDNVTVLVDGVALCAMVSEPLRAPAAVGVNVTLTEQLPPAATLLPDVHVLLLTAKSPEIVVAPSVSAAVPVLDRVTVWAAAVEPTLVDAYVRDVADTLAAGLPLPAAGLAM